MIGLDQVLHAIEDKSVDTFEYNKRFLSASFRNFKKVFFVDSSTPLSLTRSTKQVFFGVSSVLLSMIVGRHKTISLIGSPYQIIGTVK